MKVSDEKYATFFRVYGSFDDSFLLSQEVFSRKWKCFWWLLGCPKIHRPMTFRSAGLRSGRSLVRGFYRVSSIWRPPSNRWAFPNRRALFLGLSFTEWVSTRYPRSRRGSEQISQIPCLEENISYYYHCSLLVWRERILLNGKIGKHPTRESKI